MEGTLLHDRRVLVVEDEYMIAETICRGLRRAGATVLGPVSNVAAALALIDADLEIDAAVLDINLGEQKVYPVVDALLARGARCVFATGNDLADVPQAYAAMSRCEKPVDPRCLILALSAPAAGDGPATPHGRADVLCAMRSHLLRHIEAADRIDEPLIAVKLCEVLDVLDRARRR